MVNLTRLLRTVTVCVLILTNLYLLKHLNDVKQLADVKEPRIDSKLAYTVDTHMFEKLIDFRETLKKFKQSETGDSHSPQAGDSHSRPAPTTDYTATTQHSSPPPTTTPSTRTVVIIVSDYRSGSSLLGEMFNNNEKVFYLFEPMKDYDVAHHEEAFLKKFVRCEPPNWGILRRNSKSTCQATWKVTHPSLQDCLVAECRSYPVLAAKFIRVRSIERLVETGIMANPNTHLIHNFRDPRGTINSRLQYSTVYYNGRSVPISEITTTIIGEIAASLCSRYHTDTLYGQRVLGTRYLRVNYEDICQDPAETIGVVYNHVGLTPPKEVFDWFSAHTQSDGDVGDRMGLERDAKRTAVKWQSELKKEYICEIEDKCRDFLTMLKVKFVC